jgi:hypothetical protein
MVWSCVLRQPVDNYCLKPWHSPVCWAHQLKTTGVIHGRAVSYSIQRDGTIVRSCIIILNGEQIQIETDGDNNKKFVQNDSKTHQTILLSEVFGVCLCRKIENVRVLILWVIYAVLIKYMCKNGGRIVYISDIMWSAVHLWPLTLLTVARGAYSNTYY